MEERIIIEVVDKIPTSIEKKLKGIGNAAELSALKLERAKNATAVSSERLIQFQRKSEIEMQRLVKATAQAESAVLRLQKAQDRLARSSRRASSGGGFTLPGRGMLKGGLAALGVGLGVKEIIDLGNEYVTLTNKIKVVTDSETQHAQVMSRVFDIANTTRTSVSDTATAFQRLDMALKPLGASQSETLRMTETINKAFILGGASTQEAAGALRQLTQAFNAGKLAGDEYRSVSENAPIIMEALSRSLGKTKGELKEMSAEGKITSEVLRKAIGEAEILIDARFSKTVPTMGQAVEVLKNKLIELFGEIENKSGLFGGIASGIISISNEVTDLSGAVSDLFKAFGDLKSITGLGTENIQGWLALRRVIQGVTVLISAVIDGLKLVSVGSLQLVESVLKLGRAVTGAVYTSAKLLPEMAPGRNELVAFLNGTTTALNLLEVSVGDLKMEIFKSGSGLAKTISGVLDTEEALIAQRKLKEEIKSQRLEIERLATAYLNMEEIVKKSPSGIGKSNLSILKSQYEEAKKNLDIMMKNSGLRPAGEGTGTGKLKSDNLGNKKGRSEKLWFTGRKFGEPGVDILQDPLERMASQSWMLTDATANLTERDLTKLNAIQTELNGILEDTIGKVNELDIKIKATQKAMQLGVDPNEALLAAFPDLLGGTRVEEDVRLKREKERYDKLKELAKDSAKGKEALRQYEAKKEMEDYQKKLGYAETFFGNLSSLQQTSSKETFALGKAAALASAGVQSAQAILKIYGDSTISPWIQSAMAASVAIATGVQVANIASAEMPGYEAGGYTGDMGRKQVAGVVHGREFVVNAAATARNRASLEAMNAGKSVGNNVSVTIENYGTSKDFEVQNNEGNLRIIARDEISRMVPTLVSAELANPNSKTSKSLARNTNTTRQR